MDFLSGCGNEFILIGRHNMNFFDKYHIMRRLLIVAFSFCLLIITYKIFCNGVTNLDVFKVSIYVSFSGIITFMLKFYFDSRNIEIKSDIKMKEKKGKENEC